MQKTIYNIEKRAQLALQSIDEGIIDNRMTDRIERMIYYGAAGHICHWPDSGQGEALKFHVTTKSAIWGAICLITVVYGWQNVYAKFKLLNMSITVKKNGVIMRNKLALSFMWPNLIGSYIRLYIGHTSFCSNWYKLRGADPENEMEENAFYTRFHNSLEQR